MKNAPAKHMLNEGLAALARAAGKASVRGAKAGLFLLHERLEALTEGAVLIAVADINGVAVRLVDTAVQHPIESLDDFARRVAEIDLVASQIAHEVRPTPSAPTLTPQEESVLRGGGLEPDTLEANERHLLYQATAEYADLLHDAYDVDQAARILRVNRSRIRQRLTGTPRTLYGVKHGKSWRIPRFQFLQRQLVPGIESVVSRLPENLHPVAVYRWFTSPNQDLTIVERLVSPLDWLKSGNPPQAVADLATEL
jgi:hypothetical protein